MTKKDYKEFFETFPQLTVGETYMLRMMTHNDANDLLEYIKDPEVNRYIPSECVPQTYDAAIEEINYSNNLFRYQNSIYWAIAEVENNKMIGSCGYNYWNREHSRAEVSYDLARPYWGKGIMSQILGIILAFGYETMHLNRIEATVSPDNIASTKVLERWGFIREGVLRQQKFLKDKHEDAVMYSLLAEEFKRKQIS